MLQYAAYDKTAVQNYFLLFERFKQVKCKLYVGQTLVNVQALTVRE